MRYRTIEEPRYTEQQAALKRIAKALGFVYFLPDYHSKGNDANTVLFYTKEDHAHNLAVDKQRELGLVSVDEYRDYAAWFSNTDANGRPSYDFANFGIADLRGLNWEACLATAIAMNAAYKCRPTGIPTAIAMNAAYKCRPTGIPVETTEYIDAWSEYNLRRIQFFKRVHGQAFFGKYNIDDKEKRAAIAAGEIDPLEKLEDQPTPNFFCDFLVPKYDAELAAYLKMWNDPEAGKNLLDLLERMRHRIEYLGGILVDWK